VDDDGGPPGPEAREAPDTPEAPEAPEAPEVGDPADPRVVEYAGLRDHELRRRREGPDGDLGGVFVADGDAVVARAVAAGHQLRSLFVDAARARPLPAEVLAAAAAVGAPVLRAGPAVVEAVSGRRRYRDCLASFDRPPLPDPAELVAASRGLVALEGVVNPNNVGVITRSAVALGADGLLLDPSSCDPLYRRASRVSMGTCFSLPHCRLGSFPGGLDVARRAGFALVALTPAAGATALRDLPLAPGQPVVLVLGTEGEGLGDATLEAADHRARVPLRRGVDSLNVGAAAAIACYELFTRGPERPAPATR
jgi:tRNA G18 (ribose-2'-O)-methylase SpoU